MYIALRLISHFSLPNCITTGLTQFKIDMLYSSRNVIISRLHLRRIQIFKELRFFTQSRSVLIDDKKALTLKHLRTNRHNYNNNTQTITDINRLITELAGYCKETNFNNVPKISTLLRSIANLNKHLLVDCSSKIYPLLKGFVFVNESSSLVQQDLNSNASQLSSTNDNKLLKSNDLAEWMWAFPRLGFTMEAPHHQSFVYKLMDLFSSKTELTEKQVTIFVGKV